MKLFNQKLKLINKNYPLTLPWVILGGQIVSGAFILTEITLMVWFCLKHRKSMNTLLKLGFNLACNIQKDHKINEHLVQQSPTDNHNHSTRPTSKTPFNIHWMCCFFSKPNTDERTTNIPSTSTGIPSPSWQTKTHHCTLEFITKAAQELHAKGQLCIKPYAGYLKEKCKHDHTLEDKL